jgi:hypothetical protein
MRSAQLLLAGIALLAAGCEGKKPGPGEEVQDPARSKAASDRLSATVQGDPYRLRLSANELTYCDARGARKLDLTSGKESAGGDACPAKAEEVNASCSGFTTEVTVRSPAGEPNDIVDVNERSFPMKGRVHDCGGFGKSLIVLTGSGVVLIDKGTGVTKQLSEKEGTRVAAGAGWVAWAEDAKVTAVLAK